ncbi:MAG TPA: hypothetical protein V6D17_18515 [Candidatus Obscuribacterales bacterium]
MKAFLRAVLSYAWIVAVVLTMFGLIALARGQASPLMVMLLLIDTPLYLVTRVALPRLRREAAAAIPETGQVKIVSTEGNPAS